MSSTWAFAEELWHLHFEPLRSIGYELERPDEANYWEQHETELRSHFPAEAIISLQKLRSEHEKAGQTLLARTEGAKSLEDFCFVRHEGRLAAAFAGQQKSAGAYRMRHSNVHREYRRRGIYRQILDSTIAYTAALGFDRVVSDHAPGNNAILIAKLRAGFRITAMEIDPGVGTSIVLSYFHNPDHLAAYEFRCGLATMSSQILRHSYGGMPTLVRQFKSFDEDDQ